MANAVRIDRYRARHELLTELRLPLFPEGKPAGHFSARTREKLSSHGFSERVIQRFELAVALYKKRKSLLALFDSKEVKARRKRITDALRNVISEIDGAPALIRDDLNHLRETLATWNSLLAVRKGRPVDAARRELHLDVGRALHMDGIPLLKTTGGDLATALHLVVRAAEPNIKFSDPKQTDRYVAGTVNAENAEFFAETGLAHPSSLSKT